MDNGASSYRRFLDGDKEAFNEIITEYRDGLTFFIDRYVNDIWAAEDIVIDVFTELVVHKYRYNFKVKLKTYLYMMGRSRALDYLKHRKKITFTELSEGEEVASRELLEDAMLADERKRILHQAMEQLPTEMQEVLHLIYFEELSYEETAKVMKKNKKQIDNLLYRSKNTLRTILGKEGEQLI